MSKQDFYRQRYSELQPGWQDSQTIYKELLEKKIKAQTKVLDIGCGHSTFLKQAYSQTALTYGVDPDQGALDKNTLIKHKFAVLGDNLPFTNNFFDLVVSAWVLEHLDNPEKFFQEIHRVLKPGGEVIFLTPNALNYNTWIIRAIPNHFHHFFTKKLYGRQEGDTYPVRYRINTPGKINRVLARIGFKKTQLIINGDPSYISFNRPLFWIASNIEKVLAKPSLEKFRVHLLGIYKKI